MFTGFFLSASSTGVHTRSQKAGSFLPDLPQYPAPSNTPLAQRRRSVTVTGISGRRSTQAPPSDPLGPDSGPYWGASESEASYQAASVGPMRGGRWEVYSRARRGPAVTGERLRMRRRTSGFALPLQPLSGPGAAKAAPRTSELQRAEPAPGTGGAGPSPGWA